MVKKPEIALFVSCLIDALRPSIAFNVIEILEKQGYDVIVPLEQTCCGQPGFNSGDLVQTRKLAIKFMQEFSLYTYIVIPSGSCASMVIKYYEDLFDDTMIEYKEMAKNIARKTYEFCDFLHHRNIHIEPYHKQKNVTYHDSCSGLRALNVKKQPRSLLVKKNVKIHEMKDCETCCGFGGTFCVKYSDISTKIVMEKVENIKGSIKDANVTHVVGGDLGCLINIKGALSRAEENIKAMHIAEILAGYADGDGIGD